jgi:hypothetical protein
MTMTRLIVLRLCSPELDGSWMEVKLKPEPFTVIHGDGVTQTPLVCTGDVEWDGFDHCAEVFVPKDKLAQWRAEHSIDTDAR